MSECVSLTRDVTVVMIVMMRDDNLRILLCTLTDDVITDSDGALTATVPSQIPKTVHTTPSVTSVNLTPVRED